jgi:hypothetical protein
MIGHPVCDLMQNQSEKTGASAAPAAASPSSANVDLRCALTLARVALQTLTDLNPEAASAVNDALGHEIETARVDSGPDTLAVIAILADVRARLLGEDVQATGEDGAWYID